MAETTTGVNRLNTLLKDIEVATMTTIRPDGTLHSCPMMTSPIDGNETLWFLSKTHTEKVESLSTDRRVNLAYADPVSTRYVSITGICQLVRDHEQTKRLWTPAFAEWFPEGPGAEDLVLLKVHVVEAEYWDKTEGRMVGVPGLRSSLSSAGTPEVVSHDFNR